MDETSSLLNLMQTLIVVTNCHMLIHHVLYRNYLASQFCFASCICVKLNFLFFFRDIRHEESRQSEKMMEGLIENLGVCPLPDASPALK